MATFNPGTLGNLAAATVSGNMLVYGTTTFVGDARANAEFATETAGDFMTAGGGVGPAAFVPGASGVATTVSTTNNVVLICTSAGTQSANGAINGVSIGAQWAAGQTVYLKADDTITWTGTVAPTFMFMTA